VKVATLPVYIKSNGTARAPAADATSINSITAPLKSCFTRQPRGCPASGNARSRPIFARTDGWTRRRKSSWLNIRTRSFASPLSVSFPHSISFCPGVRRTKARWFQDCYSELAAKFPYASFYFIGHSYATYMLGRSLAKVSMIRFVSAYMAGSVLPATYDWTACFNRRQLQAMPVGEMCQLDYCVALSASCATLEPGDSRDSRAYQPSFEN